MSAAKSEMN